MGGEKPKERFEATIHGDPLKIDEKERAMLQRSEDLDVLETVRTSLTGYPTHRTYLEFIDQFGVFALELMNGSCDERTVTDRILQKLQLENFQLGKTKFFLRAGQIAILDSRRIEVLDGAAKMIQSHFRAWLARKKFVLIKSVAITLQAYYRSCLARIVYATRKQAAANHDGVDVVSMSIGGDVHLLDTTAVGSFHAAKEGIPVVCSAGEEGLEPGTVKNLAPWIFTVAANIHDRAFHTYLSLGDKKRIQGTSFSDSGLTAFKPIVRREDVKASNTSEDATRDCLPESLDPKKAGIKPNLSISINMKIDEEEEKSPGSNTSKDECARYDV